MQDYDAIALYSGGTDSTLAPLMARPIVGEKVLLLMVDLGEPDGSVAQARERAEFLEWDFELVDGTVEFAEAMLAEAIQFRGSYWGYPLGTPLGRAFQCNVANEMLRRLYEQTKRPRYLIHGCSGRQNTRFRIERSCDTQMDVFPFGPLVTTTLTRAEKKAELEQHGIATGPSDDIARDENIFCRALEGDALNNLRDPEALELFSLVVDPTKAPDDPEQLTLTFEGGCPTAIDGVPKPLADIIRECRERGARHGLGRICVFEDTVPELGYKERSIFESPASALIFAAHRYVESAVLNRQERMLMRDLRQKWADLVYRGFWSTAERAEFASIAQPLQDRVNGTVELKMFKGSLGVGDAEIPGSLMIVPGELAGTY